MPKATQKTRTKWSGLVSWVAELNSTELSSRLGKLMGQTGGAEGHPAELQRTVLGKGNGVLKHVVGHMVEHVIAGVRCR